MSLPAPQLPSDPSATAPDPGAGFAAGPFPPAAGPFCRCCGSVPAVQATVRGHQGFLVVMRFLKLRGPFCRDCGTAVFRDMTAKSLWQGWWGIASMVINPVTMLVNLVALAKIRRLAPPVAGAPGVPLTPGRPLLRRVEILGLLLPVLVVGAIAFTASRDPDYADVGDCVHNGGSDLRPDLGVVDCSGPDAQFRIVARFEVSDAEVCKGYQQTDAAYVQERGSKVYTLCLSEVRSS
ncbi:hypothetical protein AB0442_33575 [Kitasatospora sp. NPDC085895]|uniref:LppU/SCO3897 family protein n=1 Tax=Kitasatospora sp. NPDC085895 TaxID=3155057 RepID=UPI00344CEE10